MNDLADLFLNPLSAKQRRYEAIRAMVVEKLSAEEAGKRFNYTPNTLYTFVRDVRAGKLTLFPEDLSTTEQPRRTPEEVQQQILKLRKNQWSSYDIASYLKREKGYHISVRTVERILNDFGLTKLSRRSQKELGLTKKHQVIPEKATVLDFDKLKPFTMDCPVAGVFCFIPYIIDSQLLSILEQCQLPSSSVIQSKQAVLAMLLLKLIGNERLSHMNAYNHEPALGLFAGLTVLPKNTYMTTYSCRTSEEMVLTLQTQLLKRFQKWCGQLYQSPYINLDFHSIPHYGDESRMEKVWVGAKHQSHKGANTIFAQDASSNVIVYTRSDILRKDEANEILAFVNYWKSIRKNVHETLVFDCKLTSYHILNQLSLDTIKFITLRKRYKKLIEHVKQIDDWQRVYLPIPKRKHKYAKVYEETVQLADNFQPMRQIIIKDHGRENPTFIITNDFDLPIKDIMIVYAKRWRIEQKLGEMVGFFNLNALSSPLMIRIHFDILWTMIADTLYRCFAQDLPRFEHEQAKSIFKRFINFPGKVQFDGNEFIVKIRKRAHTPVLLKIEKLTQGVKVPWLDNRRLRIQWTA